MVFSQLIYGSILIGLAYYNRTKDTLSHKNNIMFGSFMLIQPAWDRAAGNLFGSVGIEWLVFYIVFFGLFIWYHKRIKWQIVVGFLIWLAGLTNLVLHMN